GKATYTPNPGAHGEDTFTYTVKDKAGNISEPATVTVHISANPNAQDDGASTQENTPVAIDILNNDSDKDGDLDPTSVTIVKSPAQGTVAIDPISGKATYTPNPGAHGEDT
ncbi:Ig-like domain-containing protein, partial [Moellerella wisconsensis]